MNPWNRIQRLSFVERGFRIVRVINVTSFLQNGKLALEIALVVGGLNLGVGLDAAEPLPIGLIDFISTTWRCVRLQPVCVVTRRRSIARWRRQDLNAVVSFQLLKSVFIFFQFAYHAISRTCSRAPSEVAHAAFARRTILQHASW